MKRQRLFCRCATVVAQVVVDKETHLQLSTDVPIVQRTDNFLFLFTFFELGAWS
jgi:hypothetical protein